MKKRCIPFSSNGEMYEFVGYDLNDEEAERCYEHKKLIKGNVVWRPNKPFESTLYYDRFLHGRSSAKFCYRDAEGEKYWMFMTDMDDVIRKGVCPLELRGTFEYVKRGMNYGIKML